MHKKILGICAALIAVGALMIPASASASVTLTEHTSGGVVDSIPVGTKVTATQDATEPIAKFVAGSLSIECNENKLTGEVVKNNSINVEATIITHTFEGNQTTSGTDCKSSIGNATIDVTAGHWCVRTVTNEDNFEVEGKGCGVVGNEVFEFKITTGAGACTYSRTNLPINGIFSTTTTPATLEVTGEPEFVKTAGVLCPVGPGKITVMKFQLFTDNAAEATLSLDDIS
jgi:hypothetical protein